MLLDTEYPWCWCCGRDERQWIPDWFASWMLQRCHLGSGGGSMFRMEDRRAVNILCPRCHFVHWPSANDRQISFCEKSYPVIGNAQMVWLKWSMDQAYYDPVFIQRYWMGRPPLAEVLPRYYEDEYASRRGERPLTVADWGQTLTPGTQ